eukprot:GHVP01021452.1.p1 GENE.GHVP01021452.1~~GHVP01021452.1.p1  ORF type:complete len:1098 (+),score=234.46 GHVP01021452.1:23-3316(+)
MNSEVDQLCRVLEASMQADANIRREAETNLQTFVSKPNSMQLLAELIRHDQISHHIRLAAALLFKNTLLKPRSQNVVSDNDFEAVRRVLFPLMEAVAFDLPLRHAIEGAFRIVVLHDYPTKFGWILNDLCSVLEKMEEVTEAKIIASLAGLRIISGRFEYKVGDELPGLIDKCFPLLLNIGTKIMSLNQWTTNELHSVILKYILKIYWSATQMALAESVVVVSTLDSFMTMVAHILEQPVPVSALIDPDELNENVQMKTKKWASKIVRRILSRCSLPNNNKKETQEVIGKRFLENWANRFVVMSVEMIKKPHIQDNIVIHSPRVQNLLLQFLSQTLELSQTYKELKNYMEELLFKVCLDLFSYTDADIEMWDEDPSEFIRQRHDIVASMLQPRDAAIEFVKTTARLRSRDWMTPIFNFTVKAFQQFDSSDPNNREMRSKKYGMLLMIGSVAQRIASKKRKLNVERFLTEKVLPEFGSPDPLLRMISVWCFEALAEVDNGRIIEEWKDTNVLIDAYKKVVVLGNDPELPVRHQAGVSVKAFFQQRLKLEDDIVTEVDKVVIQSLPTLMTQLFATISLNDSEYIVMTLESLVVCYGEEMHPYASDLMRFLVEKFLEKTVPCAEAEQDDNIVNALSILTTIISLLAALVDNPAKKGSVPSNYQDLEIITRPLIARCMEVDGVDFIDDAMVALTYVSTLVQPTIPPEQWTFFEKMYLVVVKQPGDSFPSGYALDSLSSMTSVIDNLITRDPLKFISGVSQATGKTYQSMLFEMGCASLQDSGPTGTGVSSGVKLFSYCVEAFLPSYVSSVKLSAQADQIPLHPINELVTNMFEATWQFTQKARLPDDSSNVAPSLNKDSPQNLEQNEQPILYPDAKRSIVLFWSAIALYNTGLLMQILQTKPNGVQCFFQIFNTSDLKTLPCKKMALQTLVEFLKCLLEGKLSEALLGGPGSGLALIKKIQEISPQYVSQLKSADDLDDEEDTSEDSEQDLGEDQDAENLIQQGLVTRLQEIYDRDNDSSSDADWLDGYDGMHLERTAAVDFLKPLSEIRVLIKSNVETFRAALGDEGCSNLDQAAAEAEPLEEKWVKDCKEMIENTFSNK